ncbi:hypothetical protein AURDEDRAFT_168841 [Auricularia subglabra TFB-10046 SS5]|nr:hypothetical protein AURDEDRAFT_168841 [Auricularia subglabra TFB-10046 SS5]
MFGANRGVIDFRTEAMQALLQNPLDYPSWLPNPSAWDADNVARIASLRIPKTSEQGGRRGDPDMILYRLGHLEELDASFEARIREFTAGNHHWLLVNASGSGKTRIVLETLSRHWGFYLGSDLDYTVNPYGSQDFPNMVSNLALRVRDVPMTPRKERLFSLEQNYQLVATHMRQVVLARLLVFDHYVALVKQHRIDDADARVKWLWLQLRPIELVGRDIFRSVHAKLHAWSEETLMARIRELVTKHQPKLEFIAIDEAQIPAAQGPGSFLDSKHRTHQPLLHGLITYLASTFTTSRCIVSGTQVPLSLMEDAISVSGHLVKDVNPFTNLGDFGDLSRTSQYLQHFLGPGLSADECAIAHRWLRGRHRMITVLVNRTLRFGPGRFTRLLDSIVYTTADFDPHSRGTGTMIEVELSPVVGDDALEGSQSLAPALRSAVYIYLTQGFPASFTSHCMELAAPNAIEKSLEAKFVEDMLQLRHSMNLDVVSNWTILLKAQPAPVEVPLNDPPPIASQSFEEIVASKLQTLRVRIERYLQRDNPLPVWDPPAAWDQASIPGTNQGLASHLRQLALPMNPLHAGPYSLPDFLVYMLGLYRAVDGGRLSRRTARLLSGQSHRVVMNTSGSGKTRLLFETLCRQWGLYLTCAHDSVTNPYGSADVSVCLSEEFLNSLSVDGLSFVVDAWALKARSKAKAVAQLRDNQHIVEHIMTAVVLARCLVLEIYLEVARSLALGELRQLRGWVLLQLFPRLTDRGELTGPRDLFEDLTKVCVRLSPAALDAELSNVQERMPAEKFPRLVVLDEVQAVASRWRSAFCDNKQRYSRSLLRPLVMGTHKALLVARFMLGGTRLYYNDVVHALSSNVFKQKNFTEFTDLGGYFRWEKDMRRFLDHIFTRPLVDSWPRDITGNVRFWLSGRHRFLVVCVQHILMQGPGADAVRNVLDNIVYTATGEHLPIYAPLYKPIDGLQIRGLIPALMQESKERASVRRARKGVLQFLTQMTFPKYDLKDTELVELGVGRFVIRDNNLHIEISERLVLAALRSFYDSPAHSGGIREFLNTMLHNPGGSEATTGLGFEDAMIYLFWLRFAGEGARLCDVFEFEADLRPAWADWNARLIATFDPESHTAKDFVLHGLTSVLAQNCSTIKESLHWFEDTLGIPFLKPDNFFGPDIIFALLLHDPAGGEPRVLFVCVQCKNWSQLRRGFAVRQAIFTASPEGFYGSKPTHKEEVFSFLKPFPPLPGTLLESEEVRARVDTLRQAGVFATVSESPATSSRTPRKAAAGSGKGKTDEVVIEYGDKVQFAVLRCLAAFPQTAEIDRPVSKHDGIYPLATIHQDVLKLGCAVGFDRFKFALEQAEILYPTLTEEERLEMLNDEYDDQITPYDKDEALHENFRRNWEAAQAPASEVPAGAEKEKAPLAQESGDEGKSAPTPGTALRKAKTKGNGKGKASAKAPAVDDVDEWMDTEDDAPPTSKLPSKGKGKAKAKIQDEDSVGMELDEAPQPSPLPAIKSKRTAKRPRTSSLGSSANPRPKRKR